MKMLWNFLLYLHLFVLFEFATCVNVVQKFIEMPTYTEVDTGEDALLKCRISDKKGLCSWRKDNVPVGIFRGKYEWANENSLDEGDCSLWVHAATHQLDDGQWQCQVTASNFHLQDALSSPPAKLLVRLAPKLPLKFFKDSRELPGHRLTVAAGNRVTIVCEVAYGNPPSYIEWFLEKDRLTGWPQTNSSEVENTLVGTPRSFLEIEFSKSSNGRQLVCRAHYPSYPSPYYKDYFMMLNVTYAPEVSVSGSDESSLANLEEGLSALTLECRADGNPSPYVWWTKNGQVISTKGANLILVPVSRNDSGKYGCHARNFLGESVPAQIEIDIKYPPRVIWVGPSTVIEANLFSQLTLDCKAEGNPSPSYAWFYNSPSSAHINPLQDSKSRISETPSIELLNVSYHHQGWYICVATNQIASEDRFHKSETVTVKVLGIPVIAHSGVAHAGPGGEARVWAAVCANPPPRRAAWLWGSLRLDVPSKIGRYSTPKPSKDGDCYIYYLLISNTDISDTHVYVLNVENQMGFCFHSVPLTVHKSTLGIIMVALLVGAVMVAALCLILRITRRTDTVEELSAEELSARHVAVVLQPPV